MNYKKQKSTKIKHLPLEIYPKKNRNHYYEILWKKVAFELLKKHERDIKGWSLLDYGCGRGEAMQMGFEIGLDCVGTDLDKECLKISSKYGPTVLLDPYRPLQQFGEKSFDLISCFHVLEHVPSPVETLNQIRAMARRYVLVAVPNLSTFRNPLKPMSWVGCVNEGHLQSWDHGHFKRLMETHCGLQLVEWGFDNVKFPPFTHYIGSLFGEKAAIKVEVGILKKLYPFASQSVIALCRPV